MDSEQIKLRNFVDAIVSYNDLFNRNGTTIIRRTNALNDFVSVYVCSSQEPDDVLLPLNCFWIDTNLSSPTWKAMRFRSSKDPAGAFNNTWTDVDISPQSVWQKSIYDEFDTLSTNLDVASPTLLGTVSLSTAMDPQNPVALVEGSDSLTNARRPLAHEEMHPEVPASSFVTSLGDFGINRSLFGNNKFLTVGSAMDVNWNFASLPVPGDSILPEPTLYTEPTVGRLTDIDLATVSKMEVYLV